MLQLFTVLLTFVVALSPTTTQSQVFPALGSSEAPFGTDAHVAVSAYRGMV